MRLKQLWLTVLILISTACLKAQNVGIGTNTPLTKLTLQTPLNTAGFSHIGGANEIVVTESIGGVSASLGTSTNHAFRLNSNNIGRLHLYPAGEVVVGSNNFAPLGQFSVESAPGTYGITNSNGTITLSTFLGGTQSFAYIGTRGNHPLSFYTNNSPSQMILLPNGNVGIGNTSPSTRLSVTGSVSMTGGLTSDGTGRFSGSVSIGGAPLPEAGLYISRDGEALRAAGNQPFISFYNGTNYKGYVWNKGTDDMEFGTAAVNNVGKVFLSIKGIPYLTVYPNGRIGINGPLANFTTNFRQSALTVVGPVVLKDQANNFNEWAMDSYFEDLSFDFNGVSKSFIDVSGDYNTFSDVRLKEDIHPFKQVLPGIRMLQVATYHYKANEKGTKSFGLIAQNLAAYFPELVSEHSYGANGNKLMAVSYGKTGVLAIKAIQEQQEIIDAQQKKIEELEKRLERLEKRE